MARNTLQRLSGGSARFWKAASSGDWTRQRAIGCRIFSGISGAGHVRSNFELLPGGDQSLLPVDRQGPTGGRKPACLPVKSAGNRRDLGTPQPPPGGIAAVPGGGAESGDVFRGVNGPDRAMLYAVAAYTGLRAAELASLGPSSLALKGDPPTIDLEAAYSKRRRRDVQPLPQWLADRLTEWLAGKAARKPVKLRIHADASKTADVRLWPKTGWYRKAAKMLRADLQRAREAWISEAQTEGERKARESSSVLAAVDEAGRVFDFHALRHQFISALAAAGVHPKTAQQLARHSTITLTMNRYTHLAVADVAGVLDRLLEPRAIGEGSQEARATGTDGAKGITPPRRESLASPRDIPPADISGISRVISPPVGAIGKTGDSPSQETRKPLEKKGLRRGPFLASSVDRAGVEPATPGFSVQCSTS